MLNLLAFVCFLVAVISVAVSEVWLIAPLGWVAAGLALSALGGAVGFVQAKTNR